MLTTLAVIAIGLGQDLEALWDEARSACKDKAYVTVTEPLGGKGAVGTVQTFMARDGRELVYSRRDDPAWHHGGTGHIPMITVLNRVTFFDGSRRLVYDALTGEARTEENAVPNDKSLRWVRLLWLDERKVGEWKIVSSEETGILGDKDGPGRFFLLSSPKEEFNINILVRLRDGLVVWHESRSKQPETGRQEGGSAGGMVLADGRFTATEPPELGWKPPTRFPGR